MFEEYSKIKFRRQTPIISPSFFPEFPLARYSGELVTGAKKSIKILRSSTSGATLDELQSMTSRFTPWRLQVDISKLSTRDRMALIKMLKASRIINHIFINQMWSGGS
jgi:hypothetical protein